MVQKSPEKGRTLVEKLLREGRLQLVDAQPERAQELVTQARKHLVSATTLASQDGTGAFQLLYDSAAPCADSAVVLGRAFDRAWGTSRAVDFTRQRWSSSPAPPK